MKCKYCQSVCIKSGKQRNGTQKYQCKSCGKYQQATYRYKACASGINTLIVRCIKNSVGIRGIGRIAEISTTTVLKRIQSIAAETFPPTRLPPLQIYEVDEMWTFIGSKRQECWIMYAINRYTREPVAVQVGRRNSFHLKKLINKILSSHPLKIFTDRLNIYPSLIPVKIHRRRHGSTNHIERKNLTLRTHLKRLGRRTICYSKSATMLTCVLKIYLWK